MSDNLSSQDVLIKIVTAFENGGIEAAKKAAEDLKGKVAEASSASDALGGMTKVLGGNGADANKIMGTLAQTLKTGEINAGGMSRAIQGLGNMFGMSLGGVGAIVGGVVTAFSVLKEAHDAQEKRLRKLDEHEKQVKKSADDAVAALLDLDKARFDAAKGEVEKLRGEIEALGNAAKTARDRLDSIADAKLGVEIAKIDAQVASGEIDSTEGEWLKGIARSNAAQHKEDRELADLAEEEARLGNAAKTTAEAAAAAADALAQAQEELAVAQAQVDRLEKRLQRCHMGLLAQQQTQQELAAARQSRQAAAQKVADASVEQAATQAAADEAQAQLDTRAPAIAAQREIIGLHREARGYYDTAADSKRDAAIRAELDQEKAEREKAAAEARKKAEEEAAAAAAAADAAAHTPRALSREVGGMVGKGQRYKGQVYDESVDRGAVREQALGTLREAVNAAAASKGGDAEEAAIIGQAVDAIESMGANLLADKAQIAAKLQELVNAVQKVESQLKHQRS